jgi:hypothetical protein
MRRLVAVKRRFRYEQRTEVGHSPGRLGMATLTEFVAAIAVHSSAAAMSHFGVTLAPAQVVTPAQPTPVAERVIARSPRPPEKKLAVCPKPRARSGWSHV